MASKKTMFKLIGLYLDLNQKNYVDLVLNHCDNISDKESQSYKDNSICIKYGINAFPAFILLKNDVLTRKVIGKFPIKTIKQKLLI